MAGSIAKAPKSELSWTRLPAHSSALCYEEPFYLWSVRLLHAISSSNAGINTMFICLE